MERTVAETNEPSLCENADLFVIPDGSSDNEERFTIKPSERLIFSFPNFGDDMLRIQNSSCKIQLPSFPIDRPWLPPRALFIIGKIRRGPVEESELTALFDLVANQATEHFKIQIGKFVASTLDGRIVEVSDSRLGLLKKLQGRNFTEQIFVWKAGSKSFSGRL